MKIKRKAKKIYLKFCPKCSSGDINQDKSTMQSLGYLPTKYICSNCGYSSFNFPEIEDVKVKKLKPEAHRKEKESELIDTSYGKFYVRVMWKIAGPSFSLLGIVLLYFGLRIMDYFQISLSLGLIVFGLGMSYITFIKLSNK